MTKTTRFTLVLLCAGCGNSGSGASTASASAAASASPPTPSAAFLVGVDLAPMDGLTQQKAKVVLKAHGCAAPNSGIGPGRDFDSHCEAGGVRTEAQFVEIGTIHTLRAKRETVTKDRVFVERNGLLLAAAVKRSGKLDVPASESLLKDLVAAGSAEDPYAVVTPPTDTWLQPKVEKVGKEMVIAPSLVQDIGAALKALKYADADKPMPRMFQTVDTTDAKAGTIVSDKIGPDNAWIAIRCRLDDPKKNEINDAWPGQAVYITGSCMVTAQAQKNGEPDKAASTELLDKVLSSPRPKR